MSDDDIPDDDENEPLPTTQPTVDSATPEGQREQRSKADADKRETEKFWRGVLADPIGRREMWRLFFGSNSTHAFNQDFSISPVGFPDPNAAWYQRGRQDFGLWFYHKLLAIDRTSVGMMHDEHDPRFAKPETKRLRRSA